MKELIHPNDIYKMNWIDGNKEWGSVKYPKELELKLHTHSSENTITESYTFTNTTNKDIFTSSTDIGIYTTFNDNYDSSEICIKNRCHTHIWCGGEISYVMALRMGGKSPHLGMVLTKGGLCGYSVERDLSKISNDRGDFIMHPSPLHLAPNESYTIEWILFWHNGKEDFFNKLPLYNPNFIKISAKNYIVFEEENIELEISPAFSFNKNDIKITRSNEEIPFEINDNKIHISEQALENSEYIYNIDICGIKTYCKILCIPKLNELSKKRCNFITSKQQFNLKNNSLDGAFLIYDNEEKHCYYNHKNDYNAGRERVGMGLLITKYLQKHKDKNIEKSLQKYIKFVKRELIDENTGEVFNDYKRDNSYFRLYNFPWYSELFLELYHLYNQVDYLNLSFKILNTFYTYGGTKFYAIEIPIKNIIEALEKENLNLEKNILLNYFKEHSNFIMKQGTNYPAHEVKYEQSIVAPAAWILIQTYEITKEEKYLTAAKKQLEILELFNGVQPDYHLYETAIRHWDGYWFGKYKTYGDTFPHYWSSLTGNVFKEFAKVLNDTSYLNKAELSLRSSLSLFKPDGSASCAMVYPLTVNGKSTNFYDPFANDQDWGLYFMLRYIENL